jgi:hypothetical protein
VDLRSGGSPILVHLNDAPRLAFCAELHADVHALQANRAFVAAAVVEHDVVGLDISGVVTQAVSPEYLPLACLSRPMLNGSYSADRLVTDLLFGVAGSGRPWLLGITDVGQKSHLARAFDRGRDLALVLPAGAGVAAAPDLAALGDETAELHDVLVVNFYDLFSTEETGPPTLVQPLAFLSRSS